jgi:16S rRNA (uracil1498-N3)-methyltransferase
MNIILFRPHEVELPLSRHDPRARHILDILRRRPGDTFDAGLINGPRGRGTLVSIENELLFITFVWGEFPPPPCPLTLVIGLPRPQTARDILRDATTLGVAALHFVCTDKGEPSYACSKLWQDGEWERHIITGAEQAFCTRLPEVTHGHELAAILAGLPAGSTRIALDNYEAPVALGTGPLSGRTSAVLALGAERGWSEVDRGRLRSAGFAFAHLGPRVLRTETACVAAITLLKARLGWT